MSLVGKSVPKFSAKAVKKDQIIEHFSLEDLTGKYVVFFFYPLDFTFVCPTELHAFEALREEFEKRNAALVGCSIDSHFSHLAWLNQPKRERRNPRSELSNRCRPYQRNRNRFWSLKRRRRDRL